MAAHSGGRRWVPQYWLECEEVAPGLHRLPRMSSGSADVALVESAYEYRLVYDVARDMWRLDRRRFVPGG
jgi:hypothetical protein